MAHGHGLWPWPLAMAKAMALGHGQRPWPQALRAFGGQVFLLQKNVFCGSLRPRPLSVTLHETTDDFQEKLISMMKTHFSAKSVCTSTTCGMNLNVKALGNQREVFLLDVV